VNGGYLLVVAMMIVALIGILVALSAESSDAAREAAVRQRLDFEPDVAPTPATEANPASSLGEVDSGEMARTARTHEEVDA
jgi:hypothetical protein